TGLLLWQHIRPVKVVGSPDDADFLRSLPVALVVAVFQFLALGGFDKSKGHIVVAHFLPVYLALVLRHVYTQYGIAERIMPFRPDWLLLFCEKLHIEHQQTNSSHNANPDPERQFRLFFLAFFSLW